MPPEKQMLKKLVAQSTANTITELTRQTRQAQTKFLAWQNI